MKKLFAEFFGTYWLVFGGCGSALFAAGIPNLGIGFAGVSLAFGLTVLTMAYAVGHISGGHFNPAVSFGLWAGGRFDAKDLLGYIAAQCIGAIAAAASLFFIWSGKTGNSIDNTKAGAFASNGYGNFSPDGYSMISCFTAELLLTMFFLLIILGATDKFANGKFAGVAIGLGLTLALALALALRIWVGVGVGLAVGVGAGVPVRVRIRVWVLAVAAAAVITATTTATQVR